MHRIWARLRSVGRALTRPRQVDADIHDEMGFHIDMEADRLVREQGLDATEARRRACVAFGGVEKYKQAGRATHPLHWIDALSLDLRLGVRMLVKHRALTLIGSFALAVAIALGATSFEIITEAMYAPLPLDEGNRVVSLQYASDNPGNPDRRLLSDFARWRGELSSIQQLSAFRTIERNLLASDAPPEPVFIAQISPSAFAVARTPPLLGRYLLPDDEREGAPRVLVIGHRAWQTRFGADPQIVGRTVALDAEPHVVVGVMPEGFRFPINHQYWVPLRTGALQFEPLDGPEIYVFGRLAPGISLDEAQVELTTISQRAALTNPQVYGRMRLLALPYTREHAEVDEPFVAWLMWLMQLLISGLVAVVGINVAILMYAQTMARRTEMAMRTALGAGRLRILTQLFLEAFALSILGAAAGLGIAHVALQQFLAVLIDSGATFIPYWIDLRVSPTTMLYAVGMAAAAAFLVGVLPGLKVTGAGMQASLRELGGGTTAKLGRTWTFLVVAQVAAAVAVLPLAMLMVWKVAQIETGDAGFPVERYVVAEVSLDDPAELATRHEALMARLQREAGVSAVTFSSAVPGSSSGYSLLEFDLATPAGGDDNLLASDALRRPIGSVEVGIEWFETYRARLIAGRTFGAADLAGTTAVVVDRTFVEMMMGTRPVLGQRFRYKNVDEDPSGAAQWYEIVGVVNDVPAFPLEPGTEEQPIVYHLARVGDVHPVVLNVQFAGAIPADFVGRMRSIAAEVHPSLQMRNVMPLAESFDQVRSFGRLLASGLLLVTISVLSLSAAGIYALLSFTVQQRTREIGIRTALGASPRRVMTGIFGRVTRQISIGLVIGSLLASVVVTGVAITRLEAVALLLIVPTIVVVVGIVAALGPARRSLRIQTTEALRA